MIYKRTLILNDINSKSSTKKGVLTLENNNNQLVGSLRLYNICTEQTKDVALGLNVGNEILKIPVEFDGNVCTFKTKNTLDLGGRVSCALVDISRVNNPNIVIGGSSTYVQEWASRVEQAFCQDVEPLSQEQMYSIDEQDIEQVVSQTLQDDQEYQDCSQCTKCRYREAFFAEQKVESKQVETQQPDYCDCVEGDLQVDILAQNQQATNDGQTSLPNTQEQTQQSQEQESEQEAEHNGDIEPDLEKQTTQTMQESQFINLKADESEAWAEDSNFYEQVKSQIDDLFEQYSREEVLEQILPNSKWVRVRYENSDNFYVLGLIYEDEQIKYISYGLPADNPNRPPQDLREYAQWLPLNANESQDKGYWLVYQSADSGESIQVEVI